MKAGLMAMVVIRVATVVGGGVVEMVVVVL